jgi:ABC-type transport system involved in Fe-S cluster assembly fused permease/ATPase subunit
LPAFGRPTAAYSDCAGILKKHAHPDFDEPTSAVDIHTEHEIMQATEQLVHGRTTFVIAHRLSTIENCNLQLVLKEGKLMTLTNDFEHATAVLAGERTEAAAVRL